MERAESGQSSNYPFLGRLLGYILNMRRNGMARDSIVRTLEPEARLHGYEEIGNNRLIRSLRPDPANPLAAGCSFEGGPWPDQGLFE